MNRLAHNNVGLEFYFVVYSYYIIQLLYYYSTTILCLLSLNNLDLSSVLIMHKTFKIRSYTIF